MKISLDSEEEWYVKEEGGKRYGYREGKAGWSQRSELVACQGTYMLIEQSCSLLAYLAGNKREGRGGMLHCSEGRSHQTSSPDRAPAQGVTAGASRLLGDAQHQVK